MKNTTLIVLALAIVQLAAWFAFAFAPLAVPNLTHTTWLLIDYANAALALVLTGKWEEEA